MTTRTSASHQLATASRIVQLCQPISGWQRPLACPARRLILSLPTLEDLVLDDLHLSAQEIHEVQHRTTTQLRFIRKRVLEAYADTLRDTLSMEALGGRSDSEIAEALASYWEATFVRQCDGMIVSVKNKITQLAARPEGMMGKKGAFSDRTYDILETAYQRSHSLNPLETKLLADAAGITAQQVRTWFQNKRNWKPKATPTKRSTSASTTASTTTTASSISTPAPIPAPPSAPAPAPYFSQRAYDDANGPAVPNLADTLYPINQPGNAVAFERVIRTLPSRRRVQPFPSFSTDDKVASSTTTASSPSSTSDGSSSSPPSSEDGGSTRIVYVPSYVPGEQYVNMELYAGTVPVPTTLNTINETTATIPQFTDVYLANNQAAQGSQDWSSSYIPYSAQMIQPLQQLDAASVMAIPAQDQVQPMVAPELYQLSPNTRNSDTNSMVTDFATFTTTEPGQMTYSLSSFTTPEPELSNSQSQLDRSVSSLSDTSATQVGRTMEDDPFLSMFIDASPAPTNLTEYFDNNNNININGGTEYTFATAQQMVDAGNMEQWTREQHHEIQDWIFDVLPFDQLPPQHQQDSPAASFYPPSVISA